MRQHPQHHDEFDPFTALGGTQQEPLFPAPPRTPRGPSQAQQDAPYALAGELSRLLRGCPWAGPSPVNIGALAKNISTWKKDGLTADQIRQMMTLYVSDGTPRNTGKAPWIDFLARRSALYQQAHRAQQHEEMEDHRYDEAYWLGDLAPR